MSLIRDGMTFPTEHDDWKETVLIGAVLSNVFGYVAVAAIVNFANEGRFGAAFDFESIEVVVRNRDYAIAWVLSVAVFVAASVVVGTRNAIRFLGAIIGAFLFFHVQMVAARLWASGYNDARGRGETISRSRVDEPAI